MLRQIKFHEIPHGAAVSYNPAFRTLTLEEIDKVIDFDNNWKPYGYNEGLYNPNTASVYFVRAVLNVPSHIQTKILQATLNL
jgi:hypothetical protein